MISLRQDTRHDTRPERSFRQPHSPERWYEERIVCWSKVNGLVSSLASAMTGAGYADSDFFKLRFALDEAIANGLSRSELHSLERRLLVRYRVNPAFVVVEVENPRGQPAA
jgi:hypothetical protein